MWKHEILASLGKDVAGDLFSKGYKALLSHAYRELEGAQQFFISNIESAQKELKSAFPWGSEINFDAYPMPYDSTLLCFSDSKNNHYASFYCKSFIPDRGPSICIPFVKATESWILTPFFGVINRDGYTSRCYCPETPESFSDECIRYLMDQSFTNLAILSTFLSCKNITTEEIQPPEKVNKKRLKSGKLPLYSYHVLNVMTPGAAANKNRKPGDPLSHNRLHFQRGHFKRFTEANPLFGKHTGLYWWQPHLRGQNKDGFVDKDYNVVTA